VVRPDCVCCAERTFATGEPCSVVHEHGKPPGPGSNVEIRTFPLRDGKGNVISVIETVTDITERRRLEDQLRQAQKMEAIGQLAGGVAHDFNNVLTAIAGYGSLLIRKTKDRGEVHHYAEQILASADRAAKLTSSLLTFSRKQVVEMRPVDLNDVVKGIDKLLRRLIGEDIELRTILKGSELMIMADSGQIEQVLMNLVANARDAMPAGGIITIETGSIDVNGPWGREHGFEATGRTAVLAVSDTGTGMDEETRSRVFDPFFTTKETGKGTGLGLAIVYGIVKQHGGSINVYSEPDRGTTFRIYIPVVHASRSGDLSVEKAPAPGGGSETVLLAEDERSVRELMKLVLESAGYRVIEAANGEEAIARFREHAGSVKLIITDVIMPHRNGKEVIDIVRAEKPEIKALFMSGYTADIIQARGIVDEGINYVSKPITPDALLRKVRSILDEE
jgi:signal transduction histidine kinase